MISHIPSDFNYRLRWGESAPRPPTAADASLLSKTISMTAEESKGPIDQYG